MPAKKYSHVKKKSASGLHKKSGTPSHGHPHHTTREGHNHLRSGYVDPQIDKSITQAMSAVAKLERAISRVLLLRYEQDIARLFSTRLYSIALIHLPTLMMRCAMITGPGWMAHNADSDEIKDFFRAVISMDMRQAGERVATKSVLWSYTALRHFAMSNNVTICRKKGLHSLRLLPYYPALKTHLDFLESMPAPTFTKPPHLGPLTEGREALEDACELKFKSSNKPGMPSNDWSDAEWRPKVRLGYERLSQTLWRVAREFDVRGYGLVLREKLTTKWCDCGCSTDHLGEVCERTVREDEEESKANVGKRREWDGRGSGIFGWETAEEEDIWEVDLDFGGLEPEEAGDGLDGEMTISELMEWRYLKAEREKEKGNVAFRRGEYMTAVKHYEAAHEIEPELPHYQLNLAAAHLKLSNWMEAEEACTRALSQHRSSKGYYRRARARKMLGRPEDAIKDLRAVLKVQSNNVEALAELESLQPPDPDPNLMAPCPSSSSPSSSSKVGPFSSSTQNIPHTAHSKPSKHVPFPRIPADEQKLKIILVPMNVDVPIYIPTLDPEPATPLSRTPAHIFRKEKQKLKQGDVKMRSETFMYPNWERYAVRKGAD